MKSFFENISYQIAHEIEAAESAMRQAIQSNREAQANAKKLIEAGWTRAVATAEALKHAAEVKLAMVASEFTLAQQAAVNAATEIQLGATLGRAAIMAQLNEVVVERDAQWKQNVAPPANVSLLDQVDRFFAGWASGLTFGGSDYLRSWMYGEIATRNHQGTSYWVGMGVGVVHSFLLGYGAAGRTIQGAVWANRALHAARIYVMVGNMYGMATSTYHLYNGTFEWYHAAGFVPMGGFLANPAKPFMRMLFTRNPWDKFHVYYGFGNQWVHGGRWTRVFPKHFANIDEMSKFFAQKIITKTPKLPVLFPEAVIKTDMRCWTCLSAAIHGFFRGWFPFI